MIDCISIVCAVADYAIPIKLETYAFEASDAAGVLIERATKHYRLVMGSQRDLPDCIRRLISWTSVMHRVILNRTVGKNKPTSSSDVARSAPQAYAIVSFGHFMMFVLSSTSTQTRTTRTLRSCLGS